MTGVSLCACYSHLCGLDLTTCDASIDYNVNEFAFVTFMYGHGLIPALPYDAARKACGWENFLSECEKDFTHPTTECQEATKKAVSFVPSPLDPYNVLAKTCHEKANASDHFVKSYTPFLHHMREKYELDIEYNPCISHLTPEYLNRKDVLKAIHADTHYTREWPNHPENWYYNEGPLGAKKDIALLFPKFFSERPDWKIA